MQAVGVGVPYFLYLLVPQHGEVRVGHFAAGRQVQPNLKQLARVGFVWVAQRKHLAMHDAFAGGQPLHITRAETRCRTQRIRMVNMPLSHDSDRLKTSVRVRRKAGNGLAVVHAPAVFVAEIAAHLPTRQRCCRSHVLIADRVVIDVMHAEQKRVNGLPGEGQSRELEYGYVIHSEARLADKNVTY